MSFEEFINSLNPQTLHIDKGETLFQQGNTVENLYFIKSGKIKLIRNTIDGKLVLLHSGQANESIAEASLFSDSYHCTAISDSSCEIKMVKKRSILQFLEANPKAMLTLLALFARQVRDLRTINETKNIRAAGERILSYIRCNINENKEMLLDQSLKDIAHKIGLAHETFYRELKKLEDSGIIQKKSDRIKLI